MGFSSEYLIDEPTREQVDALAGVTLLEFGSRDCAFCAAVQPRLELAMDGLAITHMKIEDGSGRALGRSFGVKLWPTLILLRDGVELHRVVRPNASRQLRELLDMAVESE